MCDIKNCSICNLEANNGIELKEAILDGEGDIYNVELCDKCHGIYVEDYVSPEEITKILETQAECELCGDVVHILTEKTVLKNTGDDYEQYRVCSNCINRYQMNKSGTRMTFIPHTDCKGEF